MRLFGSSKKKSAAPSQDSILQMRGTLEMLEKKEAHLESKIQAETDLARTHATSNKSLALMALKRRKLYETQREHARGARFNLETQIMTIENAHINLETLQAMRAGSSAMKNIHGELDVDKVDDVMDEVREQMDIANEISSAISNPLGMDSLIDEEDLEAELERFEQEQLDANLLEVKSPVGLMMNTGPTAARDVKSISLGAMPSAPKNALPTEMDEEEAELEKLRSAMAF